MPVNIHPNASHAFDGHVAERKAIRRLEDALFVSFATHHDSYLYALAKPTDSARERFNFDRELLAIFTPFSRSDMRTINTLKQLRRSHRDRIHPTVSLVFHKCEGKHRESLERLCRDEFENDLILVPLSILDLTQTDDPMGYLIRAFRRTIGESKIFEQSSPLTSDRFFYGRSEMVRRIADGTYQQQKHYGVFGVRKSGKTSVLYAIQRSLNDQVLSSYIDCENPDICTGDWKAALGIIFERLSASADIKPTRSFNIERPTESLRLLVNEILDSPSVVHVSVLLDEIEHITPLSLTKPWTTDFVLFWRALRSISQEVKNRLTFIVAGVNAGSVSIPHIGGEPSPLYELLNEEFLPPFTETDITEMLEDLGGLLAIKFEQGVASQLKEQYGGHPLATRIACSEVLRATQLRADRVVDGFSTFASTIEAQHFEVLSDEITDRLEWVAREILVSLALWYEDEYDILHSLALNPEDDTTLQILSNSPAMARNLSSYGLLDHQRRGLQFLSLYLQRNGEWFRREARLLGKGGFEADEIADLATSEDVAHLASLRRDVERQLRQLILRLLLVATQGKQREVARRIAMALRIGPEDYVGVGLREILDSLYFTNLAAIVSAEWGLFGWVFGNEQGRFDELTLVANQLGRRLEAHSLDLTPDQLDAGRSALSWMADRIRQSDALGGGAD